MQKNKSTSLKNGANQPAADHHNPSKRCFRMLSSVCRRV